MQYLELGPVPCDEECQQVGTAVYDDRKALDECRQYKRQLEQRFPVPEGVNAYFCIKSFPHDFGSYREVCIAYGCRGLTDEETIAFAYFVEGNLPATWDDDAVLRRTDDAPA